MKECAICGAEFEPHTYNQKYCSRECYREAQRRQHAQKGRRNAKKREKKPLEPKICGVCGKSFIPHVWTQKYCSPECKKESGRIRAAESFRRKRVKINGDAAEECTRKHLNCFECPYEDCIK